MMMGGRVWDGVRTGEGASEGKNYNKDQEEEMGGGGDAPAVKTAAACGPHLFSRSSEK